MHFAAHGSYSVERSGNILVVEATGPFNEHIIHQFENDVETCMEQLKNQAWATLVIYHGNGIFTPEAEAECIKFSDTVHAKNWLNTFFQEKSEAV